MLLEKIKNKINKVDIVSFDIFDTLLVRPYVNPEDLFEHLSLLENISNFKELRLQCFKEACDKYVNLEIEEVSFDQIYEFMPQKYKYVQQKELELEYQVLTQNPEIKKIYDYAISKGKKIIITSDMYLPESFIKSVLKKNGYDKYAKLYLSSTIKKLKYTKNMYRYILNDLKVKPKQILHIGDNKSSDVKKSRELKINAIYYRKVINKLFKLYPRMQKFYNKYCNLTTSIIFGIFAIDLIGQNQIKNDYWLNIGTQYAGPLAYSYVKTLDKWLKNDNMEEALFVARDGYTLKKIFDIIKTSNIESRYVYAPRLLSLVCTLDCSAKLKASDWEAKTALNGITSYYQEKTNHVGLDIPKFKNKEECSLFFKENYDLYETLAKEELINYRKYLDSLNVKSNNLAFIDIMTTFFTGQNLIHKACPDKHVKGYYYYYSTYFGDNPQKYEFKSLSKGIPFLPFIENLISSPEPPIEKIINNKPVYKNNICKQEKKRGQIYNLICDGAINFTLLNKNIFGDLEQFFDIETINEWISWFQATPSKLDKKKFKYFTHAWEVNHQNYKPIFPEWYNSKCFLQKIFSIKNEGKRKVLTLLGIKFKFKRKKFSNV